MFIGFERIARYFLLLFIGYWHVNLSTSFVHKSFKEFIVVQFLFQGKYLCLYYLNS